MSGAEPNKTNQTKPNQFSITSLKQIGVEPNISTNFNIWNFYLRRTWFKLDIKE